MRSITGTSVAVVGGAGFLGSHMVRALLKRDNRVLVIDNLISGRLEHLPMSGSDTYFEHTDITVSENHLYKLFKENCIKYVFNYAAEPYIPVSFERPLHVFMTNAVGALHVINAAQEAGVEGILQVSSAEIYGERYGDETTTTDESVITGIKLTEEAVVKPHSSYGAAKAAIDHMVQVRWREAKTPCIALRQFNCVGERETHPYVIPEIIRQLDDWIIPKDKSGKHVTNPRVELGNNSWRDFLYAYDAVEMAIELLEKGQFGEVYNMGSERVIKIYDLVPIIAKAMGYETATVVEDKKRKRPWEIWYLHSNNKKLYDTIDYRPQVSLESAIKKTVDWFVNNGRVWAWEHKLYCGAKTTAHPNPFIEGFSYDN